MTEPKNITVLYVGSSLLAPLRRAERDINREYQLDLSVNAHNCTLPLGEDQWSKVEKDLAKTDIVFVIHVTDSENARRISAALDRFGHRHHAIIVMNCLRDLMRRTRMGRLKLFSLLKQWSPDDNPHPALRVLGKVGSWMVHHMKSHRRGGRASSTGQYLKLIERVPALLSFIPSRGRFKDIKHYLTLFCYFLQPTPGNIRSMLLYAIRYYLPGYEASLRPASPESLPAVGIYHPEAPALFESFDAYRTWYERRPLPIAKRRERATSGNGSQRHSQETWRLDPHRTIGILLLRPQIISGARQHYDGLIRALEDEGLAVLPVISTFMDNRVACQQFLAEPSGQPRISQLLSLTGFSFVGGPAANDSQSAVAYLKRLNRPFRSAVSLEMQSIDHWAGSPIGLNPVQTAMQVAIPEIDGATEPFLFGGIPAGSEQPLPLPDRCQRLARRLTRWNRLRTAPRRDLRLAFILYCFPPNKGNLGTAADLDVFPSLWETLRHLEDEGYLVEVPSTAAELRHRILGSPDTQLSGSSHSHLSSGETLANIAHRFSVDDYFRLCPYVDEITSQWGPPPGQFHAFGRDILILGVELGQVIICVQPTFGYEGDPMRLLMAQGGAPHHGFMGLYTYLDRVFRADALVHVGTHGALEFMPGKQMGLSASCWPDRLIGEFPNIYIYSVNNPSEGAIAKRRSYAELISYLTPPIENAGLYKELASLRALLIAFRQSQDERKREQLFAAIEEKARELHLQPGQIDGSTS